MRLLTAKERDRARAVFQSLDQDKDGIITDNETRRAQPSWFQKLSQDQESQSCNVRWAESELDPSTEQSLWAAVKLELSAPQYQVGQSTSSIHPSVTHPWILSIYLFIYLALSPSATLALSLSLSYNQSELFSWISPWWVVQPVTKLEWRHLICHWCV